MSSYSAVRVGKPGDLDSLGLETLPIPDLGVGQVLVKMEFAPVNPSDIYSAYGRYPRGPFPYTIGLEGSGTVIKSGGGELADSLINKRVSLGGGNSWATHAISSAEEVYPLLDTTTFEQGAGLIVNPVTVALMLEKFKQGDHKAIVQNAAASALGKMLARWALMLDIPIVNLVRRQEQVDALKALGAQHVFNTSEAGWKENAKALCDTLAPTIAFDAIAGDSTNDIADLLSHGGVVYNYGRLSGQNTTMSSTNLLSHSKRLEGIWLTPWFRSKTYAERVETLNLIQSLLKSVFETDHGKVITLPEVKEMVLDYNNISKTNNKFLIRTIID
jgi:NADPH:quinone reductase